MTAATAVAVPRRGRWVDRFVAGLSAVLVKELRGRMRGRRAFVIVTLYVGVLAVFAWMALTIFEARAERFSTSTIVSSQIGQQLFAALLLLETLLVPFLAPALTASAISLEREKQTLDMVVATPISPLGLVLGKLMSALTYVFLLVLASIPLTALVFVFGGVGYEELATGYLVLIVTAIGFGSIGLFFSALVQRTQAATVLTYVVVFALTAGALFVWIFWRIVSYDIRVDQGANDQGIVVLTDRNRPPEALLYFNPFVSQAEIIRDAESGTGAFCGFMADAGLGAFCSLMNQLTPPVVSTVTPVPASREPNVPLLVDDGFQGMNADPLGGIPLREITAPAVQVETATFWPRATLAWIILSVVLIGLSVRLVTPVTGRRPRSRRVGSGGATP